MLIEFDMSLMGELNYLLGLKIKKMENGTFISQTKYFLELLKKCGINKSKTISEPMASNVLIDKDENGLEIETTKYRCVI